jgi:hypothetical protein
MNKLLRKIAEIEKLADELNEMLLPYDAYFAKLRISLVDSSLSERIQMAKLIAEIQDNAPSTATYK